VGLGGTVAGGCRSEQGYEAGGIEDEVEDGVRSVGRVVVADDGEKLGVGLVEAEASGVLREVAQVGEPPVKEVDDDPEREEDGGGDHSGSGLAGEAPGEPEQERADDEVGVELVVADGEVELPIPAAEREPAEDLVVKEESSEEDGCELAEVGHELVAGEKQVPRFARNGRKKDKGEKGRQGLEKERQGRERKTRARKRKKGDTENKAKKTRRKK